MTDSQDEVTQFIATKLALTDTASGAGDALELETTLAQSLTVLYADRVVPGAYNRSIGVGADSLVITEYAPTINQLGTAVSPANDTLIITEYAPSAYVDQIARPGADSLVITEYAPSVATDQIVAVANDTLAITEYAPTVSSNADNTIAVANDTLVITEQAPSVVVDQVIAVGQDTLTITEYAPTVNVQADTTISVANDTLVITEYAPTVTGGDAYIVNSLAPPVVADFAGVLNSGTEYYRVGGSDSTFDSMFTFSRTSNATMVDSDGLWKWAPHNILLQSNSFTTTWTQTNINTPTSGVSDPDGGSSAWNLIEDSNNSYHRLAQDVALTGGVQYTFECVAQQDTQSFVGLAISRVAAGADYVSASWNLSTGALADSHTDGSRFTLDSTSITSLGGGWYRCRIEFTTTASATERFLISVMETGVIDTASTSRGGESYAGDGTSNIHVYASGVYRSDLGMVDNPDRGDSYVPTTTAAVYQARRNHYRYNGSTYDNKGILLESEARTNLVTQSNDFSTTWLQSAAGGFTLTAADSTGPDGTASMTKLAITDTTNEKHRLYISVTGSTSAVTQSFYIKPGTLQYIALRMYNASGGTNYAWVTSVYDMSGLTVTDTQTGSGGTGSITHNGSGIESVGGGIYRIWISTTGVFSTDHTAMIMAVSGATPTLDSVTGDESFAGTTGQYVHIYGAQYEVGSTPSSYIPTTGATVTRAAETLTIDSTNLSYSATAMSFHIKGEMNYADRNVIGETNFFYFGEDLGSTSEYIQYNLNTDAGTGEIIFRHDPGVGGWNVESSANAFSPGVNVAYNLASWHTTASMNAAVGGTAIGENTSVSSMPALTSQDLWFGDDRSATGRNRIGTYEIWRMWDADIGDTGIESATS